MIAENNYFKIRAIYKSSIEPYFEHATLEPDEAVWRAIDIQRNAQNRDAAVMGRSSQKDGGPRGA